MLNIAPFITPLAAHPDPNAAVSNALHARGLANSNANEKARLAEQANEFSQRQALNERQQGFNEATDARDFEQHRAELHTKLVDWGMQVLDKEGPEKAQQIVGPVWQAAGIGVDFGGSPEATTGGQVAPGGSATPAEAQGDEEMGALEAAQKARGDLEEYQPGEGSTGPKPGESFTAYVSRNTSAKPSPVEKETPAEDMAEGGVEEPTEAPAAAPSRQWRVFDQKTGRQLGVIDPDKLASENQKRADERAAAYVSGTPDNRKGIIEGMTSAARTPEEVETGMKHGEFTFGQLEKTDRTIKNHKGGGGVPPVLSGEPTGDPKELSRFDSDARQYMTAAMNNAGVKNLNKMASDSERVASMLGSDVPADQRMAIASQIKANFGAAASEGERAFILESSGAINKILFGIDSWVKTGQVPEGLREGMQQVAVGARKFATELADQVAEKASQDIMESPTIGGRLPHIFKGKLTPEMREKIRGPLKNIGRVEGSGGGGAPSGDADKEFDKLGI